MNFAEGVHEENRRLRRAMRDMVALSSLPAIWVGLGLDGIARSLADVLLNTLSLEFVFVRLEGGSRDDVVEVCRSSVQPAVRDIEAIRAELAAQLSTGQLSAPSTIINPFGDGMLRVAVTRFGMGDDTGVLIAGSSRPEFPTDTDRALLGVGAHQTAIVVQRRRAEESMRERQEWLHVTLASIGDAVIATDMAGCVSFLNVVAEKLTGWASESARGRPLEDVFRLVNDKTRRPAENPVQRVLKRGVVLEPTNDNILIARDGTERPIDESAAPIRDAAGKIIGVVVVFRDATIQREAENRLRNSEALKSAVLDSALDCIITMDHEGNVVEFNPAAEHTFGFKREDVLGRKLSELIIPTAYRDRHQRKLAECVATGEGSLLGTRVEYPALCADGSEIPVELAITRMPTDGPPLFTAHLRDISDRVRINRHRNLRLAVAQILATAPNVAEPARELLRTVCECLGWDAGFYWTRERDSEALACIAHWHRADIDISRFVANTHARSFRRGEGLPGSAWEARIPVSLPDVTQADNFPRAAVAREDGLHGAFACPLIAGSRTVGVIEFFSRRIREPDAPMLETMAIVAGLIAHFADRIQAEETIRENQARLDLALQAADLGHWEFDLADGPAFRNRRHDEIFGYNHVLPEWTYRTFLDHVLPEDRAAVDAKFQHAVSSGEQWDCECRILRADAAVRWIWVKGRAFHFGGTTGQRMAGTLADITDRKILDEELRDTRSRLDAALEAGAIVTWTWDIRNNRLFASERLARLFGLDPSDAAGGHLDNYIDSIHPDDRPRVVDALRRSVATGEDYEADYRIQQKDGSVVWVVARGRAERDGSGNPIRMPGVLVDITERKRLEEELHLRVEQLAQADRRKEELLASLRESEEKLRLLADTIPQLAWMAHADGQVFWFNRRWYEYTGTSLDQMERFGWESVLEPAMRATVSERWNASLVSGIPFEMVFPIKRADGQFRPFLTRVNPLHHPDGSILYWCGTNTDVSDIKRMEDALRETDRRKDEFLATLAHELRNPLAPICMSLQILKMPNVDEDTLQKTKHVMERQVNQLIRLVDDLLDVSRVMRGKIELRREPVELATIVARAVETAQPLIQMHEHELQVAVPSDSLLIEVDPVRLSQAISNLLANAAKYTEPGGMIWVSAQQDGEDAVLRIRDNGVGIAPHMISQVFELFVQVDHRTTRSHGGLGIGLTLAKNLVEMHHGTIEAYSAGPGQGAEFIIRLPLMHNDAVARYPDRNVELLPAVDESRFRLLVVDDNKDVATALATLLRLQGHDVQVVHDGQTALEVARAFRPALVFLDIGMPGMDGYEVARRLRSMHDLENCVLVAVTGWGQQEDRRRSAAAGFDYHLIKPLAAEVLQEMLSALTTGKKPPTRGGSTTESAAADSTSPRLQ